MPQGSASTSLDILGAATHQRHVDILKPGCQFHWGSKLWRLNRLGWGRKGQLLPATISEHTVSLLEELADHGCRLAVGQIVGIPTVVSFFAKTVQEISVNTETKR